MAGAPQQPLTFTDVFDDGDVEEAKGARTVQRIRANSSIMQLKKILGEQGLPDLTGPQRPQLPVWFGYLKSGY
jgi:hypothetical protein